MGNCASHEIAYLKVDYWFCIHAIIEHAWIFEKNISSQLTAKFEINALNPGGHFLAKTFQGGTEADLLTMLKKNFKQVIHIKPPASRAESVEMYLLAKGFKGRG